MIYKNILFFIEYTISFAIDSIFVFVYIVHIYTFVKDTNIYCLFSLRTNSSNFASEVAATHLVPAETYQLPACITEHTPCGVVPSRNLVPLSGVVMVIISEISHLILGTTRRDVSLKKLKMIAPCARDPLWNLSKDQIFSHAMLHDS